MIRKYPSTFPFPVQLIILSLLHFPVSLRHLPLLIRVVRGVILIRSKEHLNGTDVEDRNDVLLEGISQDEKICCIRIAPVINTRDAGSISSIENHIQGIDREGCAANRDRESRRRGCARDDISPIFITVSRGWRESLVDSVCNTGWEVV